MPKGYEVCRLYHIENDAPVCTPHALGGLRRDFAAGEGREREGEGMRGRKEARDRRTSGLLGIQPQYLRAAGAQIMLMRKLAAKPQLRLQAAERHVPTKNGPACTGALRALHHASGLERAHAVSLLSWASFFPRAVYAGCAHRAVCSPVLPCAVLRCACACPFTCTCQCKYTSIRTCRCQPDRELQAGTGDLASSLSIGWC